MLNFNKNWILLFVLAFGPVSYLGCINPGKPSPFETKISIKNDFVPFTYAYQYKYNKGVGEIAVPQHDNYVVFSYYDYPNQVMYLYRNGKLHRISNEHGFAFNPVCSPDGNYIAFSQASKMKEKKSALHMQ